MKEFELYRGKWMVPAGNAAYKAAIDGSLEGYDCCRRWLREYWENHRGESSYLLIDRMRSKGVSLGVANGREAETVVHRKRRGDGFLDKESFNKAKRMYYMCFIEGKDYGQIAEELGIHKSGVCSKVRKYISKINDTEALKELENRRRRVKELENRRRRVKEKKDLMGFRNEAKLERAKKMYEMCISNGISYHKASEEFGVTSTSVQKSVMKYVAGMNEGVAIGKKEIFCGFNTGENLSRAKRMYELHEGGMSMADIARMFGYKDRTGPKHMIRHYEKRVLRGGKNGNE